MSRKKGALAPGLLLLQSWNRRIDRQTDEGVGSVDNKVGKVGMGAK